MPAPQLPETARNEQREVTLLFADLRGFTQLAEVLDTDPMFCDVLARVMDCLTEAVLEHNGFVIDYYGDGLVAMWNAPVEQTDHADLACSCALRMLETLPRVADETHGIMPAALRLGAGIHTGTVQLGNAGSTQKVKYGPRGPNVHIASRVEAATKELQIPLLATRATADRLAEDFATNRVCRAQMPGLREPVDLYAVMKVPQNADSDDSRRAKQAWQAYRKALTLFERARHDEALAAVLQIDPALTEVPARFLREQIERERGTRLRRRATDRPAPISGVVALTSK